MAKYIVIAGTIPALKHTKRHVKGAKGTHRMVRMGDVLDESFFENGEIADMTRKGFIEEFEPHKLTKQDLEVTHTVRNGVTGSPEVRKANQHLIDQHGLKPGDIIHKNHKGFKPAKVEAPKKVEDSNI